MLASLPAMPQSYVRYAPLAVHAYAAAELQRSAADSSARAMHILAWFGNGGPYLRYKAASGAADATSAADKCAPVLSTSLFCFIPCASVLCCDLHTCLSHVMYACLQVSETELA